ncbi:MAG: 4'-phosphopantetheinyl transferase superfamily protein [Acidobacteriia bacterium]|nr:4'-phosphopantetheinyl transferase superfamily protein [Terriglobia bacterium]
MKRAAATPKLHWPSPPPRETLALGSDELQLWCAALSEFRDEVARFVTLLSEAERSKASGFHFPAHRDSYILRHGILRILLSGYRKQHPRDIEFSFRPLGKPELKDGLPQAPLHFSHSHSGDLALYAITRSCPVGVDVECLKPVPDMDQIVRQFFSSQEIQALAALPEEERLHAFYACWTRKEACLKVDGEGISQGVKHVDFSHTLLQETKTLETVGDLQRPDRWRLQSLAPAAGYLGAVAYERPALRVTQWSLPASLALICAT